jgi:hypothetical protein
LAIATILLCLAAIEMAMRWRDWPRPVLSGWRASLTPGGSAAGTDRTGRMRPVMPVNQYGWRGRPNQQHRYDDFVVVLTGGAEVECLACPPDETMDVILERALRRYNPNARVVTLGSTGYGQDQQFLALHEYFAREHADLVIDWAFPAHDVPANTFRSGAGQPGKLVLKPTFAYLNNNLRGPTEPIGWPIYTTKLSTLLRPLLIDIDRNWTILLPKPDPGASAPPPDVQPREHVDEALEQQRGDWSIWLTPRPARVSYGIDLTRALFAHMRALSRLRGARFVVLMTPSPAEAQTETPVALEHAGHWFVADPATRDAAIAQLTEGYSPITLPPDGGRDGSPEAERRIMARLAEVLNQRDLLSPPAVVRQRH